MTRGLRFYTVYRDPTRPDADRQTVFVKEGFCWPAFFVPLLWLIYHRLWLGILAFFLVAGIVGVISQMLNSPPTVLALSVALNLLVGAEANNWRRWTLRRKDYDPQAIVGATSLELAETKYFTENPHLV